MYVHESILNSRIYYTETMQLTETSQGVLHPVVKRGLSIRQRLPLLICLLLLLVILSSGLASYYYIRKASVETGKERLSSLVSQLSSLLSQSTASMISAVKKTADNDTIQRYTFMQDAGLRDGAFYYIKKMRTDSTVALVELLDRNLEPVLQYSEAQPKLQGRLHALVLEGRSMMPVQGKAGNMYSLNGSVYFPVIVPVNYHKELTGYLVNWRLLASNQKSIEALNQLMGKGTNLYLGNEDGSVWSDMAKPVSVPFDRVVKEDKFMRYRNSHNDDVLAAAELIGSSRWQVLIEMKTSTMIEGAGRFLRQAIFTGIILLVGGFVIAWLLSNNITKPLKQLTRASLAISKGEVTQPVETDRGDELGELAHAFNVMNAEIVQNKAKLEEKVAERTRQLEQVNKELEAFSYSVSHDLRAPLRAITGYANMLEEDMCTQLEAEQRRLLEVIKKNTHKMGMLIDDLLNFSRVSRHDIQQTKVPTEDVVDEVVRSLTGEESMIKWVKGPLLPVTGDITMIRQVWTNLLSNAVKYTGRRENPVIETGSYTDGGQIVFFVKDNGAGFDERYKGKLFKVFQRLHGAEEFEGTGVGLAIVEKIVSKHGGRVWAEGEIEKGACFYFSLPGS